jgi:AcrR family transcriptional regulator
MLYVGSKRNYKCDKLGHMVQTAPRVGERRPGGRAARVRSAVLDATSALLTEVGYDQLSIDAVASRAGVHKTTVYRRWPTKPELIADAARMQAAENVPIPDTGTLRGDLRALAREVAANIGSDGGARRARTIVAAAASSPELADVMHAFWAHRLGEAAAIIQRAIDRHELPATVNSNLLIEAVVAPIWLRVLLTGEDVDDDFADDIAELITTGAGHQ